MKSFRLKFIDVDESFSTATMEAPIKGFMVCRAPKGTTEATYFPYGNEKKINAMIGLQTANWPDLYEAIAFNTEYGLYISAPPGTATNYASYYGGVYITTSGIHNYWRVEDKDEPSYEIQLYPTFEASDYNSSYTRSEYGVAQLSIKKGAQSVIQLTNVSAALMQKVSYMNFMGWKDSATGLSNNQEVSYHFVNDNLYSVVNDEDKTIVGYRELTESGTYTIVLGATGQIVDEETGEKKYTMATNTATSKGELFLDFMNLFDYSKFVDENGVLAPVTCTDKGINPNELSGEAFLNYLIINGAGSKFKLEYTAASAGDSKLEGDTTTTTTLSDTMVWVSPFKGLKDRWYYRVNVKSDTFLRISQLSPSETATSVTISNIGYDKYKYDLNVRYILKDDFEDYEQTTSGGTQLHKGIKSLTTGTINLAGATTISKKAPLENFVKDLIASNADGIIDVITTADNSDGSWAEPLATNLHTLWQYNVSTHSWTDVTADYKTKSFYLEGALMYTAGNYAYSNDDNSSLVSATYNTGYVDATCKYSVWYIESAGMTGEYNHVTYKRSEDADATYSMISDIDFNTVTLSCREVVYPGSYMSGGEYVGSLSETGVDANGAGIYWPNVLTEGDSFIEVTPVHTLDELGVINANGFFTGTKIVDPIGPAQDTYSFTIKGQRTMTEAVNTNIKAGTLGCAWTKNALTNDSSTSVESVFAAAINQGIIEAQQSQYDDALVMMECSGQEIFKSKLMSLRTTYHDTCTIISPKMISKAEFNQPETIVVAGRSKGTAQYVGEFKMYDTYTGKYYWCQPIGDVGVNLARIMEKKLGGVAPAGTNDSNGLGGVLSRAVLDKKWDFSDDALRIMDEKGINPITYDATNGLMMQSQKSTQDPATVTDWSYLGHSMSFDLCKREIRDNVMVKQLHKRISDYYYKIRTKQVQEILDKRTTGSDPIWSYASVDIAGVNTPSTKAQRKFMITVKVRVYPYSDYVVLTFTTLAQE